LCFVLGPHSGYSSLLNLDFFFVDFPTKSLYIFRNLNSCSHESPTKNCEFCNIFFPWIHNSKNSDKNLSLGRYCSQWRAKNTQIWNLGEFELRFRIRSQTEIRLATPGFALNRFATATNLIMWKTHLRHYRSAQSGNVFS